MTGAGLVALDADVTSPLFVLHVGGVALALVLSGYALRNREYPGVVWFAAWTACTAAWLSANTVGLVVGAVESRIVVQSLALAVTPFTATCWFAFAMTYTGRGSALTTSRLGGLAALAVGLSALAATNPSHGLVVADLAVQHVAGVETIPTIAPGPGFWLVNAYVYPVFFVGLVLLVELVHSGRRLYADQGVALLLAAGLPLVSALLYVSGRSPVQVNLTPLASAISAGPLAYAVFRSQLLDRVPAFQRVGERAAVHALDDGVIVLDPADRVTVVNEGAVELFGEGREAIRGQQIGRLLQDSSLEPSTRWLAQASEGDTAGAVADAVDDGVGTGTDAPGTGDASEDPSNGGTPVPSRLRHERTGRIYSVTESSIEDRGGGDLGRTLVFRDVTEERRRKQRLLVLNRVVRHNLRNDMTVLLGHARLLDSEEETDSLAVIEEIGTDLIGLGEKAQEIDTIIRETAEESRPVNVAGIVDRVVEHHRGERPDVAFDLRVPDQAWTDSHGPVIEAIVSNLVENAVQHGTSASVGRTTDGGTDAVGRGDAEHSSTTTDDSTAPPEDAGRSDTDGEPHVTVALERLSDRIELVVIDDGPGIPDHEIDTVRNGEITDLQHASGLGLWMVKWCVDLADADWSVDTDSGTRIQVTFPRSGVNAESTE